MLNSMLSNPLTDKQLMNVDIWLTGILISIGIMPNLSGHLFLRQSILFKLKNPTILSFNEIYFAISKNTRFSVANIERNIRHAIEQAYHLSKLTKINSLFGMPICDKDYCITSAQLISILATLAHQHIVREIA